MKRTQGFISAMVSSATFGMIPLFSMPALGAGMSTMSIVVYRFIIASITMAVIMRFMGCSFRINWGHVWRISILAVINLLSAISLIYGYNLMPSGAATIVQFSYPVFTPLLMVMFFHEKLKVRTIIAVILAIAGVAAISGIDHDKGAISLWGVALELFSGFTYAVYMILVPKLKLNDMESSKLTFYVFLFSCVFMGILTLFMGGIDPIPSSTVAINLVLLGMIPTSISNMTLIVGLRAIGSTLTSILGALEPLVAVLIGVFYLHEPFSWLTGIGFVFIIASVYLLIKPDKEPTEQLAVQPADNDN